MNVVADLGRAIGRTSFRRKPGPPRLVDTKVRVGFAGVLVLLLVIGALSYNATLDIHRAEEWEEQLMAAMNRLEAITVELQDAESAHRGYLITGDDSYLLPQRAASSLIEQDIAALRSLTTSYPELQQQIEMLEPRIASHLLELERSNELRRQGGRAPELTVDLTHQENRDAVEIGQLIAALRDEHRALVRQWVVKADALERSLYMNLALGSVVTLVAIGWSAVQIERDRRARARADDDLRTSRDQLSIILQGVADGIAVQDTSNRLLYANAAAALALGFPSKQSLLSTPATEMLQQLELFDEAGQRLEPSAFPGWRALRGEAHSEMIICFRRRATGDERWLVVKATPARRLDGTIRFAITILHDITERVEAYRVLEQRFQERMREIERRRQVAEGLRDILTILNSNQTLPEILETIVAKACRLLGATGGSVYRVEQAGTRQELRVVGTNGDDPDMRDVVMAALGGGRPVAITASGELPKQRGGTATRRHAKTYPDAAVWLAVPLIVKKNDPYGALVLRYERPRTFSAEELELAAALGDHATLAIENSQLRAQVAQAAIIAERSRLARDLHDAVTQTLFSTSLIADVLPRLWERNPDEARRRLNELRQLTRGALAEMRTLLLELRPTSLTEAELPELLRQLTDAMSSRARVPVTLVSEGTCRLPPNVQIVFYRIAQEALNNVLRHAEARNIVLELRCAAEQVELQIIDDGQGFDPDGVGPEQLGLGIMRERAEAIGATLRIASQPGKGSRVVLFWQSSAARPDEARS